MTRDFDPISKLWISLLALIIFSSVCSKTYVEAASPIIVKGSKLFSNDTGDQFFVKGAKHDQLGISKVDYLSNGSQCTIDAPYMKSLGLNVLAVTYANPANNHDDCMQILASHDIYVILSIASSISQITDWNAWTVDMYNIGVLQIDTFSGYTNLLGFIFDFVFTSTVLNDTTATVPMIKAAVKDLRAYRQSKQYRQIPIGVDISYYYGHSEVAPYLLCGGAAGLNAEFLSLATLFNPCSTSSSSEVGDDFAIYDALTTLYSFANVPLYLFTTSQCGTGNRVYTEQDLIYGQNISDLWSGNVISNWVDDAGNLDDLVNYANDTALAGTPTLRPEYSALSSKWATLTPSGTLSASYTPYLTTPLCPTLDTTWSINASLPLPTLAGLNLATPTTDPSQTITSGSTVVNSHGSTVSSSPGPTGSNSTRPNPSNSTSPTTKSHLSGGSIAGIVIGAIAFVILVIALIFFLLKRNRRSEVEHDVGKAAATDPNEKSEMEGEIVDRIAFGPVKPKHELHNESARLSELGEHAALYEPYSTYIHEVDSSIRSHGGDGSNIVGVSADSIFNARSKHHDPVQPNDISNHLGRDMMSPPVQTSSFEHTDLTEEADLAVQELGLLGAQKRRLTTQALAIGTRPEDLDGQKGEEWRELLAREQRIRDRLAEIQVLNEQFIGRS